MPSVVPLEASNSAWVIREGDVTTSRVTALLSSALFEVEIDSENDVYVSDGLEFPVWVRVLTEDRFLQLFTYATAEDGRLPPTLEVVNEMNSTIKLPQFQLVGDRVYANFWIAFDSGLPVKQFVRQLRRFSSAFLAGMRLCKNIE